MILKEFQALRHAEILQMHTPLVLALWVHRSEWEVTSLVAVILLTFFHFHSNYATNDLADREGDLINPRKGNLGSPHFLKSWARLSGVLGLIMGSLLGLWGVLLWITLTLMQVAYSLPPLRFKGVPPLGLFIHGLAGALYYGGPVLILFQWRNVDSIYAVFFAFLLMGASLLNEQVDETWDRQEGVNTLTLKFGMKTSVGLTYFFHALALACALTLVTLFVGPWGGVLFLLPVLTYFFASPSLRLRSRLAFSLVLLALVGVQW